MSGNSPDSAPDHGAIADATPREYDRAAPRAMARRSFSETFSHLYEPKAFAEFLDHAYGPDGAMERDLNEPAAQRMAGFCGSEPVGYAKLTPVPATLPGAVELQQIYVLATWHGRGVADHLMEWALEAAARACAPEVYLTVFDHNERAKRFYRRYGFEEVGQCAFTLGDRVDDDRVWRRSSQG